ncbi:MAG: shikimate dehydrogenase, partial [Methylophilaceae bacterium]
IDLSDINLIINATSAGVGSLVSPIQINTTNKDLVCYEMMYGKKTPFLQLAQKKNLTHFDGLGMLVQQAALSFKIWHQIKVDTSKIEADLKLTM